MSATLTARPVLPPFASGSQIVTALSASPALSASQPDCSASLFGAGGGGVVGVTAACCVGSGSGVGVVSAGGVASGVAGAVEVVGDTASGAGGVSLVAAAS